MPLLAVLAVAPLVAAQPLGADAARCRYAIAAGGRKVSDFALRQMISCERQRMKGTVAAGVNCADLADPGFPASAIVRLNAIAAAQSLKAVSACAGGSTAGDGYLTCGAPCAGQVPTIASFADVSSCVTCQAKADAAAAIQAAYGASPPVQGGATTAWRCQNSYVGNSMRRYAKARMTAQRSCQHQEDGNTIGPTDCKNADLNGHIASARGSADGIIAHCSGADLGALTSCSATVAGEQTCVVAAADTLTNALFDVIYPSPPPTATPSATATPTVTRTPQATSTPTPTSIGGSCPSSHFLNVSGAAGPGGVYSSLHPSLSVSCNASTVTVQSNGIPTYEYEALTPNGLQAKNYNFTFPLSPAAAASTTNVPLLGNVGVAVNGIPIYGVNEGPQPPSDAYGDPIAAAILDGCGSHSAQQGTFHNHALEVKCLVQSAVSESQPWNDLDPSPSTPSPIVGYAFDGFPIYGPYECVDIGCSAVQTMLSSWDNTGYQAGTVGCASSSACSSGYCTDVMIGGTPTTACVPKTCVWSNNTYSAKPGSQYLDRCNGHTGPNGDYHYHTTTAFPYILGCYKGTPTNNGGSGTPPGGTCP